MIQFRMLNRSERSCYVSPRTQNDKYKYSFEWKHILESTKNLDIREDTVIEIITENNSVIGVRTKLGAEFYAKATILTNGTFLNGVIHIGERNFIGGRLGEDAVKGLTENLNSRIQKFTLKNRHSRSS